MDLKFQEGSRIMEILVFGDSVAYGAGDIKGGWVQRLRRAMDVMRQTNPEEDNRVYNLGIGGNNTEMLLERVNSEIRQRFFEDDPLTIIFAIGLNDSTFFTDQGANWVSEEKFAENLKDLLKMAKQYTQQVIFVGLTPVDESKTVRFPGTDRSSTGTSTWRDTMPR